jgi:hypothetical protein
LTCSPRSGKNQTSWAATATMRQPARCSVDEGGNQYAFHRSSHEPAALIGHLTASPRGLAAPTAR